MVFFKKKDLREISKAEIITVSPKSNNFKNKFLEDWSGILIPHEAQKEMEKAFFVDNKKSIFNRRGRKGAKSTDNIRISWRYANEKSNRVIYICCPQIVHAAEIYWDERRLQRCDADDDRMFERYVRSEDKRTYTLYFNNGSFIRLIGTWTETRARGQQPDLIIFDEVQDCKADYIEAMDSNLAAKPDARCIMAGTPPKKHNHYQEWEKRFAAKEDGICFKHSSYINTALPHLKDWLDKKKIELYAAGKEDVWLREYMAEDCFASEDRMLPDPIILEHEDVMSKYAMKDPIRLNPVVAILITESQICIVWAIIERNKHQPIKFYILESQNIKKIWNTSFLGLDKMINEKCKEFTINSSKKNWNKLIWDETDSFTDVIQGWQKCRKDFKWKLRGTPLVKELMLNEHMLFSNRTPGIGIECQNYLRDEDIVDYPTVSAVCVLTNEYYQAPTMSKRDQEAWDKYQPLREAGIIPPISYQKERISIFRKGDLNR